MLSCPHKEVKVCELGLISFCLRCSGILKPDLCIFFAVRAVMELLFSEELGVVLEVSESDVKAVCQRYSDAGVQCHSIGRTCGFGPNAKVRRRPQHKW